MKTHRADHLCTEEEMWCNKEHIIDQAWIYFSNLEPVTEQEVQDRD